MIRPLIGPITLHQGDEPDPLPGWRSALRSTDAEGMIKLLVDIASWAQTHQKSAPAWVLLGDAYLQVRQPHAAQRAFSNALDLDENSPKAREGMGLALLELGNAPMAMTHLAAAHRLSPDDDEILVHWGLARLHAGSAKRAYRCFEEATRKNPNNPHAWLNMGLVDVNRGERASAVTHFERALAIRPTLASGLYNLAQLRQEMGDLDAALDAAQRLAALDPKAMDHWLLLAEIQLNAGDVEAAQSSLNHAKTLKPHDPGLFVALAKLYWTVGDLDNAVGVVQTGLAFNPDDTHLQMEAGHLHLLQGRYDLGWDLLEARKRQIRSAVRRFDLPEWQGGDASDQVVLVHAEQGLGDTMLFASCLPDLLPRCGHVVIEVSTRLESLFRASFPQATVVGRDPLSLEQGWLKTLAQPPQLQVPIGSLPKYFRRDAQAFPQHHGYLQAEPAAVAQWQARLAASLPDTGPRIGISWRGGLAATGRHFRSIDPAQLIRALIAQAPGVQLVCLQYGDVSDELARLRDEHGLVIHAWPEDIVDQAGAAALTCALDGVVTVCNTQAHLSGALNRPATVLVPSNANWRYGATGHTMPWYPSVRLVRQQQSEGWAGLLQRAGATLLPAGIPAHA